MTGRLRRAAESPWVIEFGVAIFASVWFARGIDPLAEFRAGAIVEALTAGTVAPAELLVTAGLWPDEGLHGLQGLALCCCSPRSHRDAES